MDKSILDGGRGLAAALLLLSLTTAPPLAAELVEYELTVARGTVNFTGEVASAMTLNGSIPGPVLRFAEGDTARITVRNEMDVSTSIHWHGILLPPGMDGVPNLTFPPIAPGTTFVYEFPIRQSGTYWYHSHSELQEQRGIYGPIVISPRSGEPDAADREHVVLFSDWTDTDARAVLRTLRRGSEWFAVERGTGQSILGAARAGKLKDYWRRELSRMPAMDISDVAYDRFLANGAVETALPAAAGERVRVRMVNGSATTFFHVEFAGGPMTVVAADGIDVEPFEIDRLLMAVAETYDVLVTVPDGGTYELRATSHDATGFASAWLGGEAGTERHPAPDVPYPNLYQDTMHGSDPEQIFALTPAGTMGMPTRRVEAGDFDRPGMNMEGHGGMDHGEMDHGEMDHDSMDHGEMDHAETDPGSMDHAEMDHGSEGHEGHGEMDHDSMDHGEMDHGEMDHGSEEHEGHGEMDHDSMDHGEMDHAEMDHGAMDHGDSEMGGEDPGGKGYGRAFGFLEADLSSRKHLAEDGGAERPWAPYDRLRARRPTAYDPDRPVKEHRLTLDGDMERYVWFLNETPLSASDDIVVREGEVTRFILINRTMMHHPMHLHGHFFRVLNGQGDYSPLKHTVNVEPMSTTVIEFLNDEKGDWLFHCHLLYHMKSGMTRVVSYESFVPPPEVQAVRHRVYHEHWYTWADAELLSHMSLGSAMHANTLNTLMADWEIGWGDVDETETEVTLTYERYRNRFLSYFAGIDVEGEGGDFEDPRGVLGVSYVLPLSFESRLWIDTEGELRATLERTFHLTPRLELEGEAEYDTGEGWEGHAALGYTLSRRLSLLAQWHSEYGLGAGVAIRF